MTICEVILIFTNYLWITGSWKGDVFSHTYLRNTQTHTHLTTYLARFPRLDRQASNRLPVRIPGLTEKICQEVNWQLEVSNPAAVPLLKALNPPKQLLHGCPVWQPPAQTTPTCILLKSEVYICQIHLNSVFHILILVLGQLGWPLHFKNVKCQNNSREWFQLLFLSSHSQWVRSLHTFN
jgi:hypothetical protein